MLNLAPEHIAQLATNIQAVFPPDVINQAFGILPYAGYAEDPVGFGEKVLGETYTDEVRILMESVRDNPVTLAKSCNAPGKTHAAARVALWWYSVYESGQVYTTAAPPERNLKKLLWGEIGSIIHDHPELFSGDTVTSMNIQRHPLQFITGVTIPTSGTEQERISKFSGKHAAYLLFILDEGDAIPDEIYTAIETCMSGGVKVRLLIMFNPKSQVGAAYRMERDKTANVVQLTAFNHPNVRTGEQIIPGAVTRDATVRRINEWCRPLVDDEEPGEGCFELPEFLVGIVGTSRAGEEFLPLVAGWYKIMEPAFSYMVLGEYPAEGSRQLISRAWVSAARRRWDAYVKDNGEIPPPHNPGVMGLDVGEFGEDPSCCMFRYGGYVEKPVTWGGVDPVVTGDRATAEYKIRNTSRANIDALGVGSGVAPQMQRANCSAMAVRVSTTASESIEQGVFFQLRDQLWWACREWLRTDPGSMLPPDEELAEELCTPTYEEDPRLGRIKVTRKDVLRDKLKRSPNKADALCLTFCQSNALFPDL